MAYLEPSRYLRSDLLQKYLTERQQETHALSGKKNEFHLVNLSREQWVFPENYSHLNSTQLLLINVALDYESTVVVQQGSNFYHWLLQKKVFVARF